MSQADFHLWQSKTSALSKLNKRRQEEDIPPTDKNSDTQLKAYKQLEANTQCEVHHGHCFISCMGGHDNHCCLDHSEMGLWAKKVVSFLFHKTNMMMY